MVTANLRVSLRPVLDLIRLHLQTDLELLRESISNHEKMMCPHCQGSQGCNTRGKLISQHVQTVRALSALDSGPLGSLKQLPSDLGRQLSPDLEECNWWEDS